MAHLPDFINIDGYGGTRPVTRVQISQVVTNPLSTPNAQKDILQIIRKEEDRAMSLLVASLLRTRRHT